MKKVKAVKEAAAKPESRFVVNKDNTVTDKKTGLQIIQDPTLLGEAFKERMTHQEAEKACAALDFAGHKDWRLPTVEELCGMVDRTKHDPCYDQAIFKGKFDDYYWAKETCAWNAVGAAWCVSSGYGFVGSYLRNRNNSVRPVRSSQ